jgi:hypothetical protein
MFNDVFTALTSRKTELCKILIPFKLSISKASGIKVDFGMAMADAK